MPGCDAAPRLGTWPLAAIPALATTRGDTVVTFTVVFGDHEIGLSVTCDATGRIYREEFLSALLLLADQAELRVTGSTRLAKLVEEFPWHNRKEGR